MKKNTIIIVLAILVFVFFVFFIFGVTQQIAAESERDAAEEQREMVRVEAINYQQEANLQRGFAERQRLRADSLQQLLDKCK